MPQRGLPGSAGTLGGLFHFLAALLGAALLVTLLASPARALQAEADVYVAQAVLAYEEKRYEDALAALRQALEIDPKNVDALYYTGLVRIALGRLEQAIEPLEKGRTLDPADDAVAFQLGVIYFSLSKYDQAQPLLEAVFTRTPRLESLGYYVGFMRYRKKDYQGALVAFRAGATADPDIQQLTRFYTGLALGVLGLPERAAAEIEEALRLLPASPLTGPAERLREAVVTTRERERRFHAEVRVGLTFDSNVPVTPNQKNSNTFVEDLRLAEKESTGELAALRLDYSFLRIGALEATATYSFFATYNNDLPSFNITSQLGGLGAAYRGVVGASPYQLGLQYTYDYLTLNDKEFAQRHTVAPVAALVEDANNLTTGQLRYQRKEYSDDTTTAREEKRDGVNWMAGLTHVYRFEGDKHLLKLGYQWDLDDTIGPTERGRNFVYFGHRVLAGGQYTLPWADLRLRYDLDVHLRDYRHRNTQANTIEPGTVDRERFDTEYNHMFGLTLPLPNNLVLNADYQVTRSRSNFASFTFDRNVVSVTLIWSY